MKYPVEPLHRIENESIPPDELKLKVGSPIMLPRNLNATNGLCNGTQLVVKSLLQHVIEATLKTGAFVTLVACIPRIKFITDSNDAI